MNILLTGGCGYVGSVLTEKLLALGHTVTVVDAQWFGNALAPHDHLKILKMDIRDTDAIPLEGVEVIMHLANVANDPCVDLDPVLSWKVNVLATMRLAERAVQHGVKQFMFASSGSVYGLSDAPKVIEETDLRPISAYNETKMVAERVLLSYSDKMIIQIARPGTVYGLSPRMRLDLLVNMLTMQALTKGEVTVLGGDQMRPTVHIDDMTDAYLFFLTHPEVQGIFNTSFENISVRDTAERIAAKIPAKIITKESNDPRSYRMCSDKILAAGFSPKKKVDDAVADIAAAYAAGTLKDEDRFYNIRWMKLHPPTL